jgi:D-alanine-D-alanine ligase-like ATP-grasp enzyme
MPLSQKVGTAQLLFNAALNMGLQPSWVVNGLFAVTINDKEEYVNYARSPLNTAVAVSLATNKYFTRMVLERHGVQNIPFTCPQTPAAAQAFLQKHGKIVAKPHHGSGAVDIHIVTTPAQLAQLDVKKYILERYIKGKELRYLVLNDSILAVHESEYGDSVASDRPLQRISYARSDWDEQLSKESLRITEALRLRFAAVDYLIDSDGSSYLLEVNTAPGLKWFHAPSTGPVVDVAAQLLRSLYKTKPYNDLAASAASPS